MSETRPAAPAPSGSGARFDTAALIHALTQDQSAPGLSIAARLTVALALAGATALVMFMLALGPREDWADALGTFFFVYKFVIVLVLACSACLLALRLTRPGASGGPNGWLMLAAPALLIGGIALDLMLSRGDVDAESWQARLIGDNALICLTAIPLMSLPLLGAAIWALRHGASTRPALSGAVAGLLAGGLAAFLYAAHCTDDSPLFVATWYSIAIGAVSVLGALIGRRVLRF